MRSPLLISAISLLFGSSLLAQTAGPIDAKAMLQGLQDIKEKQTSSAKSQLTHTIADFTAASSEDGAALNFFVEAVRVTRFVGQLREDAAFREWQKTTLPKLKPAAIRTALRYTTISLQRAAGATDDQIFPVLLAYAQDTLEELPDIGEQEIMQQPVADNIFARWYNIGDKLTGLTDWEGSPANVDSMYQKVLLPFMRKNRDPRVIQYWDSKILTEKSQASSASAAFNTDRFNLTRRPALLWSRAEDEVVIGQRDQGITDMYNLVQAFPSHPDAGKWIKELQALLTTPPTVVTGGK